jgi:hypothetical protein
MKTAVFKLLLKSLDRQKKVFRNSINMSYEQETCDLFVKEKSGLFL